MIKKYPKWIDQWAKAFYRGFKGMLPASWGPVDGIKTMCFLNGAFIEKVYLAVEKLKKEKVPLEKVAKTFSSPSSLRIAIFWLVLEYQKMIKKDKNKFREVIEFLIRVLKKMVKKDLFCYKSNIAHSNKEIKKILKTIRFKKADPFLAREIGKLSNALASLSFALYGDFFPQDTYEIYGPYKISKNKILLIKHFSKIKPLELWPKTKKFKYKDLKIFLIYKNIQYRMETIGMHHVSKGDLIRNLVSYAILVDDEYKNEIKEIKKLINYFEKISSNFSLIYEKMNLEELKKKILEWECYQFYNFFKLAKMDWKPTKEMLKRVKNKKVGLRFEAWKKYPSFKEYLKSKNFEVYWLKDLYL